MMVALKVGLQNRKLLFYDVLLLLIFFFLHYIYLLCKLFLFLFFRIFKPVSGKIIFAVVIDIFSVIRLCNSLERSIIFLKKIKG